MALTALAAPQEALNVKQFGAVGDGVVDDTVAIRACIHAAINRRTGRSEADPSWNMAVFFPPGTYRVTDSGILSDFGTTGFVRSAGWHVYGAGMRATTILLDCSDEQEKWFWDNYQAPPADPKRLMFGTFEHLCFETTSNTLGNGFRIYSAGYEKMWRFNCCLFLKMKVAVNYIGKGNADQNKFFGCIFQDISDCCHLIMNSQSLCNDMYACDFGPLFKGDLWRAEDDIVEPPPPATPLRGPLETRAGVFNVYGGSIIMAGTTEETPRYLVNYGSASAGDGNRQINFYGAKLELGAYAGLVNAPGDAGFPGVLFDGVNFYTVSGAARNAVILGDYRDVMFRHCYLSKLLKFEFQTVNRQDGVNSYIQFDDCILPDDNDGDVSSLISRSGVNAGGRVIVRNSRNKTYSALTACNLDDGWKRSGAGEPSVNVSRVVLKPDFRGWPRPADSQHTILLPPNVVITRILLYRPQPSGSSSVYQMHVGSDDMTLKYASSEHYIVPGDTVTTPVSPPKWDLPHVIDKHVLIDVGTDANLRTVRLWADPVTVNNFSVDGYAVIEYMG